MFDFKFWAKPVKDPNASFLADILADKSMKEEMLGMMSQEMPSQDQVYTDAAKILNHAQHSDYRVWAKEAWAHVLTHLDAIQDPKSTTDQVNFHRGALRESLDLLRISYRAKFVKEHLEREKASSAL